MAKSSNSSSGASQTQQSECSPNNALANKSTKLKKIENWTKEDVRHWLMDVIKVPQQYADILYKENVYGAALILFDKKDFLDAGLKHGPAVQILKNMSQYKTSSDVLKDSAIPAVEIPTDGSNDLEITPKLSIPEIQDNISSVQQLSVPLEETQYEGKTLHDTSRFQDEQDDIIYKSGGTSTVTETKDNLTTFTSDTRKNKIDDWTKEDVRQWLMDVIKVPRQYADVLYNEDVYGAALILFDKKDFLDAGLKHGPAVQILKNMSQYKTSSDVLQDSAIPAVEIPTDGSNDLEITPKLSIPEIQDNISSVQQLSVPLEETQYEGKTLHDTSRFQDEQDDIIYKSGGTSTVTETKDNLTTFTSDTRKNKIDDWTKEDVRQWLMDVIKVPRQYADVLYNEDVYGSALILFDKKDFLAFLKHGPAVQILKNMLQCKTSFDVINNSDKPTGTASLGETTTDRRPTNGLNDPKINPELSIQENKDGITSVQQWSLPTDDTPKFAVDDGKFLHDTTSFQEEKEKNESGVRCTQSTKLLMPHSTNQGHSLNNLKGAWIRLCTPRPFDESCPTFVYTQNEILPPETGPSNLIDPVHEYKLMANTENASEEDVLRKFTDELFRFAAGTLNTRTNGTIHFGVGDEPLYTHGQIVGISLTSLNKYVDAFYKRLKVHFSNRVMREIVMRCIRPPKFFQVKCPDNLDVDKWVIEVDVVPMYDLTGEKLFYTTTDKKRRKTKCFFVRDGARTTDYNPDKGPRKEMHTEKHLEHYVKSWALSRKLAEERYSKVHAQLMGDEHGGNPEPLPGSGHLSGSTASALVPP